MGVPARQPSSPAVGLQALQDAAAMVRAAVESPGTLPEVLDAVRWPAETNGMLGSVINVILRHLGCSPAEALELARGAVSALSDGVLDITAASRNGGESSRA